MKTTNSTASQPRSRCTCSSRAGTKPSRPRRGCSNRASGSGSPAGSRSQAIGVDTLQIDLDGIGTRASAPIALLVAGALSVTLFQPDGLDAQAPRTPFPAARGRKRRPQREGRGGNLPAGREHAHRPGGHERSDDKPQNTLEEGPREGVPRVRRLKNAPRAGDLVLGDGWPGRPGTPLARGGDPFGLHTTHPPQPNAPRARGGPEPALPPPTAAKNAPRARGGGGTAAARARAGPSENGMKRGRRATSHAGSARNDPWVRESAAGDSPEATPLRYR